MMRREGFTLVELLTALLIISVLLMIAAPYVTQYRLRAKIGEGLGLIGPLKNMATEFYMTNGRFPDSNADVNLGNGAEYRGNWTAAIEFSSTPSPGTIIITFDTTKLPELEANNTLMLVPTWENGHTLWTCMGGTLDDRLRPHQCRS